MPLTNALLVRYSGGFRWVLHQASIDAYGRREGYLALGAAASPTEVDRVGAAILAGAAIPALAVAAAILPVDATEEPYAAFAVGDYVTVPDDAGAPAEMRVRSLTVTEDTEGQIIFAPEFGTLAVEREQILSRWLKRMANGTLGGHAESASPAAAPDPLQASPPRMAVPPFSLAGPLTASTSGRWYPAQTIRVIKLTASINTPGSLDVVVALLKNGVQVATVTIPAGSRLGTAVCSVLYLGPDADYLQIEVVETGADATDLVVQPVLG